MIYDWDEKHAKWCTIGCEMHAISCMIGRITCTNRGIVSSHETAYLKRETVQNKEERNCLHKCSKCHHEPRKITKTTKGTKKEKRASRTSSFQLENHTTPSTPQISPHVPSFLLQTFQPLASSAGTRTPYSSTPHSITHHSTSFLHSLPYRPSSARQQTTITHTAYTAKRDTVHIALFHHS